MQPSVALSWDPEILLARNVTNLMSLDLQLQSEESWSVLQCFETHLHSCLALEAQATDIQVQKLPQLYGIGMLDFSNLDARLES